MKLILFSLFSTLFFLPYFVFQPKIHVEATLANREDLSPKKVVLLLTVKNNSNENILIPKRLRQGLSKDMITDYLIELEKSIDGSYLPEKIPDNYLPGFDELSLVELKSKDSLTSRINIAFFYAFSFPKGSFRSRVLFRVSKHNPLEDVYSNWVEFEIK